jgi:hypothetical protein
MKNTHQKPWFSRGLENIFGTVQWEMELLGFFLNNSRQFGIRSIKYPPVLKHAGKSTI